ncbi:winged helix DNA-binding domain-containing protein [Microlunatus ginsengisoli]|uniref:Winged helix DNA-binding domain-containing protein n=1 Tax=Microlunatus ginsengisoli TaxID=363863 RepID=A0ABP7A3H1_9ACTN
MTGTITDELRRARLARRHRLLPELRTDDVVRIAEDLVALHSTDPVTAMLSVMLRMRHPSVAAVEDVIYRRRELIRHHAMRRTLWVATPQTTRVMHAAATRKLVGPERRRTIGMLADSGVAEPEVWLDTARELIIDDLRRNGPSTAREIGRRVDAVRQPLRLAEGKSYAAVQGAHSRVITLLGFEGRILRARPTSWITGAYAYADAEQWLPGGVDDPALTEQEAAARLAGAYLRRFGPVTTTDLQWWAGWTLGLTRKALAACAAVEVAVAGGSGWLAADDPALDPGLDPGFDGGLDPAEPWVAVLPGLDPSTMGWKQRSWYLPESSAEAFDSVGNGGPTIWVDGRIVGAWAQNREGEIYLHYFEQVPARRRREVDDMVDELRAMIGETRFSVRFPGDVHARLLGQPIRRLRKQPPAVGGAG